VTTSFQFPVSLGGNGYYYSDGTGGNGSAGSPYGLANGGHRTHWAVCVSQTIIMCNSAASNASAAAASAAAAAASAASAAGAPGTQATSTTSMTLGSGSKSLTIQTGKLLLPNMWVVVYRTSDPTKFEFGPITGYNSGTGALTYTVVASNVTGSGTFSDWTIAHVGPQGLAGISGIAPSSAKTASFAAVAGNCYVIDGNGIVATLPASASLGDQIGFVAGNGTFTGFSVARNGLKVMGLSENMTVDITYFPFELRYYDAANGWRFSK